MAFKRKKKSVDYKDLDFSPTRERFDDGDEEDEEEEEEEITPKRKTKPKTEDIATPGLSMEELLDMVEGDLVRAYEKIKWLRQMLSQR